MMTIPRCPRCQSDLSAVVKQARAAALREAAKDCQRFAENMERQAGLRADEMDAQWSRGKATGAYYCRNWLLDLSITAEKGDGS